MNDWMQGEVRSDVVQELRARAGRSADIADLVGYILDSLGISSDRALFPVLIYFRSAFSLSLREALPLREWLSGKDRSEIDSILLPAMQRTKDQWQIQQLQSA